MRELFDGWDVQAACPSIPEWPFQEWRIGETLSPQVQDIWRRPDKHAPWAVQLMIADADGDRWLFRRNPHITRPLGDIGRRTTGGVPFITSEIQLLYKAKGMRPKDEADFWRCSHV